MNHLIVLLFVLCCLAPAQTASTQRPPDYEERVAELEQRNAETPGDPDVLDALAGSYAMGARYSDAIRITRLLVTLQPDNLTTRLRLALLYSWNGETDRAIAELRSLGGSGGPEAMELECRLLTWKPDAKGAAACYGKLRQISAPGSAQQTAAELGLARNLSWAGETRPAIRAYREYTGSAPQNTAVDLEFARLLRYQGRYSEAERVVSRILRSEPQNAVALALKSEILHWAGHRSHEAAALSAEALALRPDLPDARAVAVYALKDLGDVRGATESFHELQDRVQAAGFDRQAPYAGAYEYLSEQAPDWGRPRIELPFSTYNDSDGIHETFRASKVTLPLGNNSFWVQGQQYDASAPASSLFSYGPDAGNVRVFSAGGSLHIGPNMQVDSSAGLASFSRGSSQGVFSVGFNGSPVDRWEFHFGVTRNVMPVTPRSIGVGLAFIGLHGAAEYYFDPRTSLQLEGERGFWNDGNRSTSGSVRLQHGFVNFKAFAIDAGPQVRLEAFDRDMTWFSGMFTPDLYQSYEGSIGLHGELAKRLTYEIRPALGAQRITHASNFQASWEIASSLRVAVARQLVLSLNYQRRNYNLVSGNGSYQGLYLQLGLQP
jgi:tetratricopeptide (TPR) repeat protein